MPQGASVELTIEKMVYGGDGLARVPQASGRNKTVFVPFVLPGERIEAAVVEEKSGYSRAKAAGVLQASAHRVSPACPHFYRCGGCQYQHSAYGAQLEIKRGILLETLKRIARFDWGGEVVLHGSPEWGYRNRTRMHVQAQPFALGFYRHGSRELLPVESCPISSELVNRAIAAAWRLGRAGRFPAGTSEIEFFVDAEDNSALVELHVAYDPESGTDVDLAPFAEAMAQAVPEVAGTCAFATGGSLFPWDSMSWQSGENHLMYRTRHGAFRVQAGSFFQTNRFLVDALIGAVAEGRSGKLAYDLYAGTGIFSAALSQGFARVTAVELSPYSFEDLRANAPNNVEPVRLTTEEFLRRAQSGRGPASAPDLIVVDPPRAGIDGRTLRALVATGAPRVTYVSCDPATLARDLRGLMDAGYQTEAIHLFDMFPQTYHMETVAHLKQ
jgi:23S rRNA (uracil1939-C5)-methyltransferase